MSNSGLIDKTVEIAVAKMGNTTFTPNEESGKNVAAFMHAIYDKLVELNRADKS